MKMKRTHPDSISPSKRIALRLTQRASFCGRDASLTRIAPTRASPYTHRAQRQFYIAAFSLLLENFR